MLNSVNISQMICGFLRFNFSISNCGFLVNQNCEIFIGTASDASQIKFQNYKLLIEPRCH